jgi:PAS domain S-box-containing protein
VADTAPVMIWVSGPDKRATFFNRGWLQFTGHTMEQELGYGWAAALHPDHKGQCLASYSDAFDKRSHWHMECQVRRGDGEYRWILCNGAARFADAGEFAGYIVSGSDITVLKSAEEASLARQKLESLGVLSQGIAHDFNNLLGSIHANAELAEEAAADGEFPREEIRTIKAVSMRASEIVRQLLIYTGSERSQVEQVDLSQLVGETLDLIHISVSKSAIVKVHLGEQLPAVPGDRSRIQQVLMNLVLNASDALGEREGVITITTTVVSEGQPPDQWVCLEVSDTGCGISREAQAKIFDPFFTTKMVGRGLGLAVVQGVVRAHRAVLELTSEMGRGTTFRIFWPVAASSSGHSLPPPPAKTFTRNASTAS